MFHLGKQATTAQVISSLRSIFCQCSVPNVFCSDGGPQFIAKAFADFLSTWGITHDTSSPYYPQSNGRAEAAIKSIKKLIKRCWHCPPASMNIDEWTKALLQYRNTPPASGKSPAQLVYGHPVQDTLPAHRRAFAPEWQKANHLAEDAAAKAHDKLEKRYNSRSRPLPDLAVGNRVAVQHPVSKAWDKYGIIVETLQNRDYLVKLVTGRVLRRNRRFIRRRYPVIPGPPPSAPHPTAALAPPTGHVPPADVSTTPQRQSSRPRRPPRRLIEQC
ncbi:MAG: transposase family protein [Planctomycetota bacterium]